MPSAVPAAPVHCPRVRRWRRPIWRFLLYPVAALAVFLVVATAVLSLMGGETLRLQGERALSDLMQKPVAVSIGATGLALDGNALLAIHLDRARVAEAGGQHAFLEAGTISFAIRPLPLLAGRIELGSATIADARIDLTGDAAVPSGLFAAVLDERGLVDADRLGEVLFAGLHEVIDALDGSATDRVRLRNVELIVARDGAPGLLVERATLRRVGRHGVEIEALLGFDGREIRLAGKANRPAANQPIAEFALEAEMDAPAQPGDSDLSRHLGAVELTVAGRESSESFERLDLSVRASNVVFAPGHRDEARFNLGMSGYVQPGLDKLEISELSVRNGQSRWRFHGAVGPMPAEIDGEPSYRFELISDGSRVAPAGSLEPAIDVLAKLVGRLSPDIGQIALDAFAVRTLDGEVSGNALITLARGVSPGVELELDVADFPVGSAKQLWPWFVADGAREWAHRNLFGGRIERGRVDVSLAPGRLKPGQPLVPGEVTGEFRVERVRFDVAGRIPAVREGVGSVVFDGGLVDVGLETGTIYLASGRTVQASSGTFGIEVVPGRPLVGALDIDVSGDAAAILELASHDPINVGDHIEFGPADFEGSVSGKIVADIPLEAGVERDALEWMVVLDYRDLTLARPFHDFRISDARGSILVEPRRVVIEAETLLDGVPASVYLVEPLGGGTDAPIQEIALRIDDTARDRLVPGLAAFLSGGASVKMQGGGGARREIGIDLSNSRLSVPWAGWSKGAGIPAKASFVMETADARTVLDDFALEGETFAVRGSLALRDGELEGARFHNVRLNRSDDFAIDIGRSGRGYAIDINGRSLDARSLIKHLTSDLGAGTESADGVPVTVEMRMDRVDGFHEESLRDVRLRYSGTGSTVQDLVFSAVTSGGDAVHFRHDTVDGARNVTMQSNDAGALVRFLDLYERMEGGRIELALSGPTDGPLIGTVDARDFWIVNEPRLGSLVSTAPAGGDRSLNQALRSQIDVSRVRFDRGFASLGKGPGYLLVERGVLRSPQIGTTFRGTLYDANGRMDMSGTFMPAYGLNRLFGEIPIVGQILGNGRDGGLIGVTYRLAGEAGEPQLQINPLSVIAPGIFRSVFEFN